MNSFAEKFMQGSEGRDGVCSEAEAAAEKMEASEYVVKHACTCTWLFITPQSTPLNHSL